MPRILLTGGSGFLGSALLKDAAFSDAFFSPVDLAGAVKKFESGLFHRI